MEWEREGLLVSDDPARLDREFIVDSLRQTYWASERPAEIIQQSIQNSLCLGVYADERQIGFARVVTDSCTFSWICDLIIDPEYRGRGIGTWLMQCVIDHPNTRTTVQFLATRDAHGLYEKFGFKRRELMCRWPPRREP